MRRLALLLGTVGVGLAITATAAAAPPTLASVTVQDRHPAASFSAPKADFVTIYFASKPDQATDGSFLQENIVTLDTMTSEEIQTGRWLSESQLDPGTYYVMLRASADFGQCYNFDLGGLDPSCADGYSNIVTLVVPKPLIRYTSSMRVLRFLGQVDATLTASPLGAKQPYRLCYTAAPKGTRCLTGTLDGYSWGSGANDTLSLRTRSMATTSTLTWYVSGKKVATRKVRVR